MGEALVGSFVFGISMVAVGQCVFTSAVMAAGASLGDVLPGTCVEGCRRSGREQGSAEVFDGWDDSLACEPREPRAFRRRPPATGT